MTETLLWTFLYGSSINSDVLSEADFVPRETEVCKLSGFDIRIAPLANLVPSDGSVVYGILASATHAELARLYGHAEHVLGGVFLPRAVLAERLDGSYRPALVLHRPRNGRAAGSGIRPTDCRTGAPPRLSRLVRRTPRELRALEVTSRFPCLVVVFLAFLFSNEVFLKLLDLGMATAIFVDATMVRMVLVPAIRQLLGAANWWIPGRLDRLLPRFDVAVAGAARPSRSTGPTAA